MQKLKTHCQIQAKGLGEDLMQHVLLIGLETGYTGRKLLPLLKRMAYNQAHNPHSSFNKQLRPKNIEHSTYINLNHETAESPEKMELLEKIENIHAKEPTTKREKFIKEVYNELQIISATQLSNETGIPKKTLLKAKKRYENHIKFNIT